jgi:SAM-dependent MidA family methyltransferase
MTAKTIVVRVFWYSTSDSMPVREVAVGERPDERNPAGQWLSWRPATKHALYGPNGFYRTVGQPARHFRTAVHAAPAYVAAILALLRDIDLALDHPVQLDVVDVGAGAGELLAGLAQLAPAELTTRLRLTAVELAPRPAGLAAPITWTSTLPRSITGLVLANEWLDNVPVDVVELTADGPALVRVDPRTGAECTGAAPEDADLRWLRQWWPPADIGDRAEVGRPRDEAWAGVVRATHRGIALAVDYAHLLPARPPVGTLTGYRDGRQVTPIPDGSCDITAHVAIDACAAAGVLAGAAATLLTTQRDALRALGVHGRRPPVALASTEPGRYLAELRTAGEEAELIDRTGLGGFLWLIQAVDCCLPARLSATMRR